MKKLFANRKIFWGGIGALAVLILAVVAVQTACRLSAPDAAEPTKDPAAVLTAVMYTADAMRQLTASANPVTPSPTGASPTPGTTASPTSNSTPTATQPAGPTAPPGGLRMVFVADVTVPDGTVFAPNTAFTKTWRVRNGGTVTWTPAFSFVFASGEQMGAPAQLPLLADVAPGGEIDISVPMVSPSTDGRFQSNWLMRDPNGKLFGVDPEAKYPIYVDVVVSGGTAPGTPSPTAAVTGTVTNSAAQVSNVTLTVDNPNATSCPHTFSFTAGFSLSQAALVSYQLEAGASDPNIPINLPAAVTKNLEAGTHAVVYTLDFTSAVDAWARFHVTAPQDVVSSQVSFKLTCSP